LGSAYLSALFNDLLKKMNWRQYTNDYPQVLQANKLLLAMSVVVGIGSLIRLLPDKLDWGNWFCIVTLLYSVFGLIFNFGLGLLALLKRQKRVSIAYALMSALFFGLLKAIAAIMW